MSLSTCPSIGPSFFLCFSLSVRQPISTSVCLCARSSVHLSVCLSVRASVRRSICPSVCLSVSLFSSPSFPLFFFLSVCPLVRPSVCLSVRLFDCMTFRLSSRILSFCPSIWWSLWLSIFPFVGRFLRPSCPPVCLCFPLSVCLSAADHFQEALFC